jgi:hypothetical protein
MFCANIDVQQLTCERFGMLTRQSAEVENNLNGAERLVTSQEGYL